MNTTLLETQMNSGLFGLLPEYRTMLMADLSSATTPAKAPTPYRVGEIMVIPVHGMLLKLGGIDRNDAYSYGVCNIDVVEADLRKADVEGIGDILLEFNSPGGSVTGIYELGRLIEDIGTRRNVYGYCSNLAASAAYWLAAKTEFYCSPTSRIGFIGTTKARVCVVDQLTAAGVKVEHFSSSPRKTFGDPTTDITEDERRTITDEVGKMNALFISEIIQSRQVDTKHLDAVVLSGTEAVSANMAEGNFDSLAAFLTAFQRTQAEKF